MKQALMIGLSAASLSMASLPAEAFVVNGGFTPTGLSQSAYIGSGQVSIAGWDISKSYAFLVPDGTAATTNINQAGFGPDPVWGTPITAPSGAPVSLYGDADVTSPSGSGWFIAADGAYGAGESYTVSQTLSGLTAGKQYVVSFWQASGQQREFDGDSTSGWLVGFGGSTASSAGMNHASKAPVSGWQKQELTFTADSANPVLSFLAQGSPAGQPPFALLSDVSVKEIPTPALIPGVIGLGLTALRKRKKQSVESSAEA